MYKKIVAGLLAVVSLVSTGFFLGCKEEGAEGESGNYWRYVNGVPTIW